MGKLIGSGLLAASLMFSVSAQAGGLSSETVLHDWYQLSLKMVKHTPTFSPPVTSRAYGYFGVTAFEALASGDKNKQSLVGQLNGLKDLPARKKGARYDEAVVLNAALSTIMQKFFASTGPSGKMVMSTYAAKEAAAVSKGVRPEVLKRSEAYGVELATAIITWSATDGGADVKNVGFAPDYVPPKGPGKWVPTSALGLQQVPLLVNWGNNRTFALPDSSKCQITAPPEYSEDAKSAFYQEAKEVADIKAKLTDEQKAIARFWSDDPGLTATPAGHWISIATQIIDRDSMPAAEAAETYARLGIAMADAFIGCWKTKYEYNLLRPVTYIRKVIDPKFETLLTTPPFPEYPSGHSVQSAAAALVLTKMFGPDFSFDDDTGRKVKLPMRTFASFQAAADEAAMSRLYGGIHFRTAILRGKEEGKCIGAFATRLEMVK